MLESPPMEAKTGKLVIKRLPGRSGGINASRRAAIVAEARRTMPEPATKALGKKDTASGGGHIRFHGLDAPRQKKSG